MFVEYKVRFGQDCITISQHIDPDDSIGAQDAFADAESSDAAIVSENRLSRAAPASLPDAVSLSKGSGPGDRPRGTGPVDRPRGTGITVLGPIIINCPAPHLPPPPPPPKGDKG